MCALTLATVLWQNSCIVQTEDTDSILEALNIVKQWNPTWSPKFFLCNYSEAEIGALEQAFPNVIVYLCGFHREQAWTRWICERKHSFSGDDSDLLLSMLRACAWAPPGEEGENRDCHYQQAVTNLRSSSSYMERKHTSSTVVGIHLVKLSTGMYI